MSPTQLGNQLVDVQAGFASGENLERGGVLQVRMNNVEADGAWNWTGQRRVPATERQVDRFQLEKDDILFNATNSPELVGKSALFQGANEDVVFSNHFLRLRTDHKRLSPAFLTHWLRHQWNRRVFQSICNAWVNQASVRRDALLELTIVLPALSDQKRIAAILDKVDSVRRRRQQAMRLADDFLRATFYERCGDPVANSMSLPERQISEIGTVTTGNTPSRGLEANFGDEIEWIKSDNINTPGHTLTKRLSVNSTLSFRAAFRAVFGTKAWPHASELTHGW